MTQPGLDTFDSVNKMQAEILKGITNHELKIMTCLSTCPPFVMQINSLNMFSENNLDEDDHRFKRINLHSTQ